MEDSKSIEEIIELLGKDAKKNTIVFDEYFEIIKNSHIPMFHVNEKAGLTFTNQAFNNMLETTSQELSGFGWQQFLDPDYLPEIKIIWYDLVSKENIYKHKLHHYITKKNRKFEEFLTIFEVVDGFIGYVEQH